MSFFAVWYGVHVVSTALEGPRYVHVYVVPVW